jgi:DNA-directed RNA polymerase specialized sigma24 family protein
LFDVAAGQSATIDVELVNETVGHAIAMKSPVGAEITPSLWSHSSVQSLLSENGPQGQINLARLPDDYRDVLIFRHLESLSHDEIATRMNRSAGAVRMLWGRALAALREACGEDPVDLRGGSR